MSDGRPAAERRNTLLRTLVEFQSNNVVLETTVLRRRLGSL
jgi:hypothetical protein